MIKKEDIKDEIIENLERELNYHKAEKEELVEDLVDIEVAIETYSEIINLIKNRC